MTMDWKNKIDADWSLFLDRDGVVNVRLIDDYVKNIGEFEFLPGVLEAFGIFAKCFKHIFIITNQQGVGKGLMTSDDLCSVHEYMCKEIENHGGRVDKIYSCTQLKSEPDNYRKPSPKMAFMAKEDFPEVDFSKSIMIGDAESDIKFGMNAGMHTVLVGDEPISLEPDGHFLSLYDFAKNLI